jgi:hypothetical protein
MHGTIRRAMKVKEKMRVTRETLSRNAVLTFICGSETLALSRGYG